MANNNENNSGLSEAVNKSMNAANAIKGAMKTGKTVSSLAKGAAGLWSNRKLIGKVIASAALVLHT